MATAFSAEAARTGQAAHPRRQHAPAPGSNKYQVYFKAPAGEGELWKRVLRRAASEEEARKIFAQAEAALDTEKDLPVAADVRASRTIVGRGSSRSSPAPDSRDLAILSRSFWQMPNYSRCHPPARGSSRICNAGSSNRSTETPAKGRSTGSQKVDSNLCKR